ncbi:MAG: GMP synthase (glutamine-hydrolyzing), partial [Pirellulaceae bacterium]|nr:GMP synthase (glutamine-hydrolyzing) [Pirellulaceae bacterium]
MNKSVNPTSGNTSRVNQERVLVLDFGSQYSQLIARRVRELNVYCEIVRHNITAEQVRQHQPKGLILSGGPSSVYAKDAPQCDPELFQMGLPILG